VINFWDQIKERLRTIFDRHPELMLWVLEQGPQTDNEMGYDILQSQVHKLIHMQVHSEKKLAQLHRLITHQYNNQRIQNAINEATMLGEDELQRWLHGMLLLHLFTPQANPENERLLFDRLHDIRVVKHYRLNLTTPLPMRDDDTT
jgi:hypothetical protein